MSIAQEDFDDACTTIATQLRAGLEHSSFRDVTVVDSHGTRCLRLTKDVRPSVQASAVDNEVKTAGQELDEQDAEAMIRTPSAEPRVVAVYDTVHSPLYQVPVLYIHFRQQAGSKPSSLSLDQVYALLVPSLQQGQMQNIGILGALSMTDHPVSNLPAYFVHPCRTREAMAELLTGRTVKPIEYLLLWFGLIGAGVGLNIPADVAEVLCAP